MISALHRARLPAVHHLKISVSLKILKFSYLLRLETQNKIRDLLRLNEGSVIELDRFAGDPLDILVNGTKIAKGEIVMLANALGYDLQRLLTQKSELKAVAVYCSQSVKKLTIVYLYSAAGYHSKNK